MGQCDICVKVLIICYKTALLAAYNAGEKRQISWNEPFFIIILQCQKEQTTLPATKRNIKFNNNINNLKKLQL